MINDTNREKIKDAAVKLVLAEGIFFPSTSEIALSAGVSRTLLHYYFKHKNEIRELVTCQAMALYSLKMKQLFLKDTDLRDRIIDFSETAFEISLTYPFLDVFIIREAKSNSVLQSFLENEDTKLTKFTKELEYHLKKEEVKAGNAKNILIQLFSVTQLPPRTFLKNGYIKVDDNNILSFGNHYRTFLRGFILDTLLKYQIF